MNSMTDYSALLQPDLGQPARSIRLLDAAALEGWLVTQPGNVRSLVEAHRFSGKAGEVLILPSEGAEDWSVLAGAVFPLDAWALAGVAARLPGGTYRLADSAPGPAALGWLLAHYRFDRYRKDGEVLADRVLLTSAAADIAETLRQAEATALVRDLVNTPAEDMGPAALEAEADRLAKKHGATISVLRGDALASGFPLVHAVGRAAARENAPCMIEMHWGDPAAPRVAIIGKGVTFDSGGLDIKPPSAMRQMKKDMGGAAHALALARLVMSARLPVHLHLLLPCAENAVAGNAMRPGDIFRSRSGITVEIDNTDAEGRLLLADALTKACEEAPELIIDYATLTGAARVALGPDLPALFSTCDEAGRALQACSMAVSDPVWQLPLWAGYADMLKSDVADTANSGEGGFAGAVTAALFMQKFVSGEADWLHFDTFAWRPSPKPGRPKGGDALGLRAAWAYLKQRYGVTP